MKRSVASPADLGACELSATGRRVGNPMERTSVITTRSRLILSAVGAIAILTASACSSGVENASSNNASGAGSPSSRSPSSSSSSQITTPGSAAAAAGLATAKKNIVAAMAFPKSISVTTPLRTVPPKGKTVVFLQCSSPQCPLQGNGIKTAAASIGWNVKVLQFNESNPATLVSALKTALQYHPVAAYFSGIPLSEFASVVPLYAQDGAVIVPSYLADVKNRPGLVMGHGGNAYGVNLGKVIASEVIADSGGKANALLVGVPSYPALAIVEQSYKSTMQALCPGCKTTPLDITLPQLQGGELDSAVVSAVKRSPSVDYIASVNGDITSQLPSALKAAGLSSKYKLVSGAGTSRDQMNVKDNTQLSTMGAALSYGGFQDVDIALRLVEHMPIPAGDRAVFNPLLTQSNVGTPRDSYDLPTDYARQFEKLWNVAS